MTTRLNASLSSVNVARAYARKEGYNLSVGATKTLVHNAAMQDRFNSMSAKNANRRLNNTDFKELLFYSTALETLGNFYKIIELLSKTNLHKKKSECRRILTINPV